MPDNFNRVPFGEGVPNRGTSEMALDDWNRQMRASSVYQNFMRSNGLPTDGRVRLSRQQQEALENALRASGMQLPGGMHIDQGGNLNQKNTLVRNSLIGAGVAGAGLTGLGFAGIGPFSGLGGGGAAASATGASLPAAATEGMLPMSVAGGAGGAGAAGAAALPAGFTPGWEGNTDLIGSGIGAGGGAGGGVGGGLGRLFGGMSARDLSALGLALGGTVGGALANRNQPGIMPNTMTTDPNLQALMQTMQGRLNKSEPLYDSIMAMANGLLPTQYQKGGGGMP